MSASPRQLSLGPLEQEILTILWQRGRSSVREIQEIILQDPDRELTAASITTVLQRLAQKGWVRRDKIQRVYCWSALINQTQAQSLHAQDQLQKFLTIGQLPETLAAFAPQVDDVTLEQLEHITQQIKLARQRREQEKPCT